ncbi:MAG: methyltransferase domain-containing protein, partial [Thermoplasmata archaeon]
IENLPFKDKEFDFVYCSHVLEHVVNPEKACNELMRVAKRGYIETPTPSKDLWLNNASVSRHRWAVENINGKLVFTEYSKEEIDGLQHNILRRITTDPQTSREKAFSALMHLKANVINTMLLWEDSFEFEQLYNTKMLRSNRQLLSSNDDTLKASFEGITWEQVRLMPVKRLYAGDIPERKEYEGLIGLSLIRNDDNHLRHDITQPFPLADNLVDSFQAEDVFEHIPYEKLASVVNEIYRMLKPGGLFRLSVPDYGCDVLQNRSIRDENSRIVFDPGGGGTPENPGHVWFPRIDTVMQLLTKTKFHGSGKVELLHYYNKDGTFVAKPIDYSKGHIMRTPDFDERVQNPYRPMSLVIDLTKGREMVPQNSVKPVPTQLYKNSQNRKEFLPLMTVKNDKKGRYGKEYFDWQKNIGSFGGLANLFKFKEFINPTDTVVDFGCGGGYLLRNLQCKEKMGIEVNPHARQEAKRNG